MQNSHTCLDFVSFCCAKNKPNPIQQINWCAIDNHCLEKYFDKIQTRVFLQNKEQLIQGNNGWPMSKLVGELMKKLDRHCSPKGSNVQQLASISNPLSVCLFSRIGMSCRQIIIIFSAQLFLARVENYPLALSTLASLPTVSVFSLTLPRSRAILSEKKMV